MGSPRHELLELVLFFSNCFVLITGQECVSPQYLEHGKSGSVTCSFEEGFYGVYWYNSTDDHRNVPIAYLSLSGKGGTGITTGEFDVLTNGSLFIQNVSLRHDHVFTVTFLQSQRDSQVRIEVLVVVIVIPRTQAPIILSCGKETPVQNCLLEVSEKTTLECSVNHSRPAVDLQWTRRKGDEDVEIPFASQRLSEDICTTSHITTHVSYSDSFVLALFSCQADSPASLLERTKSFILVKNAKLDLEGVQQTRKVFPRFSRLALVCARSKVQALVWKRFIPSRNFSETILYAIQAENTISTTMNNEFSLGGTNSLILPRIDIIDEGLYSCISTDGIVENIAVYSVSALVQPVPSVPVIDGCSRGHNCAMEILLDGVLKCTVKGIRPEIQLSWNTLRESDEDAIVFTNPRSHVREKDNLFDVSLTVNFAVKELSGDRVTVKCYGAGANAEYFQLMSTVELLLNETTMSSKNEATVNNWSPLAVVTVVVVVAAIVILTAVLLKRLKGKQVTNKRDKRRQNDNSVEEMLPFNTRCVPCEEVPEMSGKQFTNNRVVREKNYISVDEMISKPIMTSEEASGLSFKRGNLIKQLQQRYKDLYNGVPLVPYRADELYCVESVYKKSVIHHLLSKKGGHEKWEKVNSYKDLFVCDENMSTRRILHAEPGYGKSIVCLKISYDWCNSDLENIEILVLLPLKQLGGVNSIYTAIKRYILPNDTKLSEEDITDILGDSKSVLVILDGFDEYPDQDTDIVTDVNSIISRRMFQQFIIVITTRSSFTPTKYPPQTEIYKLTGFDDDMRNTYIEEITNDTNTTIEVQNCLNKHPVLQDLSQVPFLFACFVHMIQELDSKEIKTATSVTEVFRAIISCFHRHMRNKGIFQDIDKYESFQKKHDDLDEITFCSLSNHKSRIVWPKDEVVKKVGPDFYKQYTQIGILVEEEGVVVVENPGSDRKDFVHKKEVSFVHKLFCEWYAAHHLFRLSTNDDAKIEELVSNLDPSTLQYVYRFACGLSIDCARKLIRYLPKLKGGEKCATLCIQEQLGAIDDFMDTISLICKHGIIISKHDSMLLQRSLVALLKTASEKNVTIKSVCVYNSLKSVDSSAITTSSGEKIYVAFPIERLKINVTDRELLETEAVQLLKFSVKCCKLNYIKFGNCVPPEDFKQLDEELLQDLQKKKIEVKWRLDFDAEFHTLNLKTGKWEKDQKEGQRTPLTPENYKLLREQHKKAIERETEEKCKNDVEKGREILSFYKNCSGLSSSYKIDLSSATSNVNLIFFTTPIAQSIAGRQKLVSRVRVYH